MLNEPKRIQWTLVFTALLIVIVQKPVSIAGQAPGSSSSLATSHGIQIRTLSLTGNPFFPPIRTNQRTLFTADNRRLYILGSQSLGFIPFPRRIAGSLEQLDLFIDDLSFVRLTNNTYHLVNSQGILTRILSEDQFSRFQIQNIPNRFLLAPGGFSIHRDGTLSFLDHKGISWLDLRIPNQRITSISNILSPTQVLVTIESNTYDQISPQIDQPVQVGILQFFSPTRQIIPGERLIITGSLQRTSNISARLFVLPNDSTQDLIAMVYDAQTTHPWIISTHQNPSAIGVKNLITQEIRQFVLPDLVGQIQECVFIDQQYYCRTTSWQMIQVDFLPTHYFHVPSREVVTLISNHIQSLRGIQNSFQEAILQNPLDFSRYLDRIRNQEELTIEQINGLFRIYSYPLRTGQFLNPVTRLGVLDILSQHNLTTSEILVFSHLLRFEYDVQAGIELIKLIENQFWPILYTQRTNLHQFLLGRASQLQYDHLEYLVGLYRRMQQKLLSQSLDQLFPENVWAGILVHQPNQRNRNLILFR